ncbi:unnamed protein product [Porites lobata]|uniref:Uncharacterized protein n=1 Tax=Porites lobata TaxID=104759 RepID=A0ABN8NSN3_9CNID|nr:unnamed protein product [Porites lobata]
MMAAYRVLCLPVLLIHWIHQGSSLPSLSSTSLSASASTSSAPASASVSFQTSAMPIVNVTLSTDSITTLASADCSQSCSGIGGTVTVTLQCKIKGTGIDQDCNAANFNATICDYVVLRDKHFVCDDVKRNYSQIVVGLDKVVQNCETVCPPDSAAGLFLHFWLVLSTLFLSIR